MNAPLHAPKGTRTTCPYCGVGCGVAGSGGRARRSGYRVIASHPANCGRLCTKGSALGETLGLEDAPASSDAARGRRDARAGELGRRPFDRGGRLPPHRRARRTRRGRVLSLRPASDRGLLRRQQADEGLHRLGQCRHQFAPVHGVRRSPAHRRAFGADVGARRLCRSGRGRSDRPCRVEHRLVSSRALPAHGREQDACAAPRSS